MKRLICLSTLSVLVGFTPVALHAADAKQSASTVTLIQPGRAASPHDTISRKIDGNRVTIIYGRPYSKAPRTGEMRKIWGELVPFDKIWRLGADEATTLITQKTIQLGTLTVPAGTYTLFLFPATDGSAQLIVNKEIGQWGVDPYHPESELGRVALNKRELSEPVDQFTMSIDKGNGGGGVLALRWEKLEYSVPFSIAK